MLKTKTYTPMNRLATTITLALALLQTAAGAQPSGEKLLRDDATGEWLIGFFPDFAAYDNRFWQYAACDGDMLSLFSDYVGLTHSAGQPAAPVRPLRAERVHKEH